MDTAETLMSSVAAQLLDLCHISTSRDMLLPSYERSCLSLCLAAHGIKMQ